MSDHTELTEPAAPESDTPNAFVIISKLEVIGGLKPATLFTEGGDTLKIAVDQIVAHCKSFVPDMTSKKDREALRSLAATIARTKTFIDDSGKEVLEDAKKLTDRVNAQRKWARDTLDELKETVRKPLTDFEEAEKALAARKVAVMEQITTISDGIEEASSENVKERISTLDTLYVDDLEDIADRAKMKIVVARGRLEKALPLALQREADALKAEEDRLAAEAEEKRLHDEKIAKDAADKATADAEAKAKADADAAKAKADADAAKAKADADASIAAEKARADQAIADANAKIAAEKKAADDAIKAKEEEDRKRAADEAHREKILAEVAEDIRKVLHDRVDYLPQAIADGKIRHVTITF
jgi:hypothetical protein